MTAAGHGWVQPNPGGVKARCGGPALCTLCQRELTELRPSITCPECDRTSHHPMDWWTGWCGNCNAYTSPSPGR